MITTLQYDQIKRKVHTTMTEAIIVALITGGISLIGTLYALGRLTQEQYMALVG